MKVNMRILTVVLSTLSISINLNTQWVQRNIGTSENLKDVAMLNKTTAIVVGTNGSILKTTDAGLTWTYKYQETDPVFMWFSISFYDSLAGIVVGSTSIATTTDGGETWNFYPLPAGKSIKSSMYPRENIIYIGDITGRVYQSTNKGVNWSSEKITEFPINSLFFWPGAHIFGMPIYAITDKILYSKIEAFGNPWTKEADLNISVAYSGKFCGGYTGFIVGMDYFPGTSIFYPAILRRASSDTSWKQVQHSIPSGNILFDVAGTLLGHVYVCGTSGIIYKSTDGGINWYACSTSTSLNINAIDFCDDFHGFAVGDTGLVLYTSTGGVSSNNDRVHQKPDIFYLSQNYPNPFNTQTTINFELPFESQVIIKIYNNIGKEILTLVNDIREAGYWSVNFDAIDLPSGVYYYRINAIPRSNRYQLFNQVKKLLLVK